MQNREKAENNGLSTAALVFSIISALSAWFPFVGIPCAVLAFVFALLSRGGRKMSTEGTVAVIVAAVGLVMGLVLFVSIWLFILRTFGVFGTDEMFRMFHGVLRRGMTGGAFIC